MLFKLLKNLLHPFRSDDSRGFGRAVFQTYPGGTPATAEDPDQEQEGAERQEQQQERQRREQRRAAMETQTAASHVSPETKQHMRECLASGSVERENLVERLLRREMQEDEFNRELETFEREDASWKTIFSTQREIRRKIQNLQWQTESYVELIPRERTCFESLLKNVRGINRLDDSTDRGLKRVLQGLTVRNEQRRLPAVLSPQEVNEIYTLDPLQAGFERTLRKYQNRIERAPNAGAAVFRRIVVLKKEEAQIERKFSRLYDESNRLIVRHLEKVRSKAERENLLKTAGRSVGITLQEGTEIEFRDPGILAFLSPKTTVKISRITFDPVPVRDHKGKMVSQINGAPIIHLNNGAEMTLGRFKKWADGVDAVEKIKNLHDVETATGLAAYGINIQPGMELFYPRKSRDRQTGEITTTPVYIRITDIRDGMIHFDSPVLFQPGMEGTDEYDMRESLTLGEFVKWWHRYEAEKSLSFHELQNLLLTYNELENKQFGLDLKENPPILLKPGEMLRYPDEIGGAYRIENVDTGGVTLDSGRKYSLPEFFSWVKNNHVRRVPEKEETPGEKAERIEREADIQRKAWEEDEDTARQRRDWERRQHEMLKFHKERAAGSLVEKLKEAWFSTTFLSLKDLWNMTVEITEFVKRKHERRSKGRYGDVGSRLPWVLGTEFERVKQAAENEEVNKYKEAMEQWSVEKVKRTLHETNSRDEAKACIQTLIHKGEMRWDDPELWQTLNRLTARHTLRGAKLYIPPPDKIPPGKSGEDMTVPAIDALWGEGSAAEWLQENISKYNSNKNNFEYMFKQLENDPKGTGGPAGRCHDLLQIWRQGGYVNPQEYEEMLDAAIKYGKMTAEGKMFYFMAGVLARHGDYPPGRNPHGETLLHLDRLGEIDSKYLNQFPILDFFTTKHVKDPITGKTRKPNKLSDYEKWMREYFPNEFIKGEPGPEFSRFMWEVIMPNEEVRTRMSKGIRNAENMDHDDAHLNIPPLTPTEIDNVTTGPTGQKKYFTNEGYANAYPGFNQYVLSLSYVLEEEADEEKRQNNLLALRDTINGFIRYDAILDNRFKRSEKDHRARLDDRHFGRKTVVGGNILLGEYQAQLRNLVLEIGRAYGVSLDWLYAKKFGLDQDGERQQREYETKLEGLKEQISSLVESDGGEKALEVIRRARALAQTNERDSKALCGIPDSRRPPSGEIQALRVSARAAQFQRGH